MRKQIERLSNQPKGAARKCQVGIQGQIRHTSKPTLLPDSRLSLRQTRHTLRWSAEAQLLGSNRPPTPPGSGPLCGGAATWGACPRGCFPLVVSEDTRARPTATAGAWRATHRHVNAPGPQEHDPDTSRRCPTTFGLRPTKTEGPV